MSKSINVLVITLTFIALLNPLFWETYYQHLSVELSHSIPHFKADKFPNFQLFREVMRCQTSQIKQHVCGLWPFLIDYFFKHDYMHLHFHLLVIPLDFKLSIWNFEMLGPLSYIYRIQSYFEYEQKVSILCLRSYNFFENNPVCIMLRHIQ